MHTIESALTCDDSAWIMYSLPITPFLRWESPIILRTGVGAGTGDTTGAGAGTVRGTEEEVVRLGALGFLGEQKRFTGPSLDTSFPLSFAFSASY